MNKLRKYIIVIVLSALFYPLHAQRIQHSVNEYWKFIKADIPAAANIHFDDSKWQPVNLPHSWNDKDVLDDEPGYYRGVGWYRKNLYFSKSDAEKAVFLNFEGANQETYLYVNNQLVGSHLGGYTAFTFDITPFVRFGESNLIAIKVDNKYNENIPPLTADFSFYGGIYRDINLILTEKTHFDLSNFGSMGVFVKTPQVSENSATVIVNTSVFNKLPTTQKLVWRNLIVDASGKVIATDSRKITLKAGQKVELATNNIVCQKPNLWSPENPYLYTVRTQLLSADTKKIIDEVSSPLGFRWFNFDANTGFSLNGKPMKLMGANRHQDYYAMANALSDEMHVRDMQLLKEMGANFVRLAHYPHNPIIYDACDRLGLIVWAEIPIVNGITANDTFTNVCKNMQSELIRQQFNHPSILMWGYMNEVLGDMNWGEKKDMPEDQKIIRMTKTAELARILDAHTRSEDPSRVTVMAIDNSPKYDEYRISIIPQVLGFNLYHGWYYDEFEDFGTYMDKYHRMYPNTPFIVSEYGAGSYQPLHSYNPVKYDHSMEWQEMYIESYYKQILERPYISGASQWNFVDFVAEMRGDYTPHYNNKGILTATRQKKSIYWFYQASLSTEPVIKFALNGWTDRRGLAANHKDTFAKEYIKIYSNADKVTLYQNGKEVGTKSPVNSTVLFEVSMSNGNNHLVAKGTKKGWNTELIESADIKMQVIGKQFDNSFQTMGVNLGSTCWFTDPESGYVWIPDKAYEKGGYGWITKDTCTAIRKTIIDHVIGSSKDPIFQTFRTNIAGFKADIPNGYYEIELLFVYPFENNVFDIFVNNQPVFNFGESEQTKMAITKKTRVNITDGEGLNIQLNAIKGSPFLNGVRITKLSQ